MNPSAVLRSIIIFAVIVPLAILLGYQLSNPLTYPSIMLVVIVLGIILLPFILKWHHAWTIVCWNLMVIAFFLPGRLNVGVLIAGLSLSIAILNRAIQGQWSFIRCRSVSYPLIALAVVTVATMQINGGFRARIFGSEDWGSRRYLAILGAILGYFAIVSEPVSPSKAKLMATLFFLSGASAIVSDLIMMGPPSLGFLYAFFPFYDVSLQDEGFNPMGRLENFPLFSQALIWVMLVRYGIRGIFDWHRPWRVVILIGLFGFGLLGGFRSYIVTFGIIFLFQCYFEGIFRTRLAMVLLGGGILAGGFLVVFAERMPMSVQRSLSFLPVKVDPIARLDAQGTMDMRLDMWRVTLPEVPKYLFRGKGFNFSSTDLMLTKTAMRRGLYDIYEATIISGDYHNGILTLIIPLGIYGFVAFLAFCWGSLRVLYANYRYGDPALRLINTFLLTYFLTRLVFYMVFYGEFFLDLMMFTGAIALSLTLNNGVRRKESPAPAPAMERGAMRRRFQPI